MLADKIQNQKEILDESDYAIPSYITDNLKYPLYDWQREALENFLINEKLRSKLLKKGQTLSPNHLMFNMATGSGKTLVMAALILYHYKQGYKNFIFFVNQNAILGKTQANFIDIKHNKYLFKENIVIDGRRVAFREVDMFSDFCDDVQIKFTTIQKLHNDIYKESENSVLLSDLQKRDVILFGDEAHHLNASTDSEIDRLLNSLEDYGNHIRAIFTVQRLTEGWDVLNLYDIVRLYTGRDTDTKTHKAGTSTTSEVQLIGRGVRYFPFIYNDMPVNRRKFDDDIGNELRMLEEFYFHSDEDHRYINELSNELKNRGLMTEKRTQKIFPVKPAQQQILNGMYLFVNSRIENPERRLKQLPKDFQNLAPFGYRITTSQYSEIRNVDFQKEDTYIAAESGQLKTEELKFSDIPTHIKYKAIHRLNTNAASYYSFENILCRFNVRSMKEFFDFIKDIKIRLTHDTDKYENLPNKKMLEMCEKFFTYLQKELEQFDKPYKGTDFRLVKFSDMFSFDQQKGKICFTKEKLISIDEQAPETQENKTLEKELQAANWYALDAFWGTSEERNLIQFIKDRKSNLLTNYDSFQLLRNEEVYKIFDFDTGRGFQPDFLLFLHGKAGNPNAYYQVFIEPKGKHLAGDDNDGWKQAFLEEISRRYGKEHIVMERNSSYVLIGLPFFNTEDKGLKSKFTENFEKTILPRH